jgi:hypothetical protein
MVEPVVFEELRMNFAFLKRVRRMPSRREGAHLRPCATRENAGIRFWL